MKGFFKIAALLIILPKNKSDFIDWTSDCDSSILNPKDILTSTHVLMSMDFLKAGIILCNNANDVVIGVVLMQDKQLLAYKSRKLNFCGTELSCS